MYKLYLKCVQKVFSFCMKPVLLLLIISEATLPSATKAQGLVFTNSVLESGNAGADGAVYRFPQVTANVDALITIMGRSSSKVKLTSLDLTGSGWNKAFQPQVAYKTSVAGQNDWWMEFEIAFVTANTKVPVAISTMDLTAIDVDGDGDDVNEWVSLYNLKSYTIERRTLLQTADILENILNILTPSGKKFTGPVTNYNNIDTNATRVMVTAKYENKTKFRIRTGGHSTAQSINADRMYSFWFKSFSYQAPVENPLPITLSSFTATKTDVRVLLNWSTDMEKNVSHFVIEKSNNGKDFSDAGLVFTEGNFNTRREYSFTDDLKNAGGSILYYRLKMVDMDGKFTQSVIRIIRLAEDKARVNMLVYPNPVVNDVRITLPLSWQNKPVVIDVLNANGQAVKHVTSSRTGQTETINVSNLPGGLYWIKASNGKETATQQLVKVK
jgi:hypothetical protein